MERKLACVVAVVLVTVSLGVCPAAAQEPPPGDALKKQVEAMQAQMDQLRRENQALRQRLDTIEQQAPPPRGFTDEDKKLLGELIERYVEKGPEVKKYPGKPEVSGMIFAQYGFQLKAGETIRSDGGANSITSDSTNGRDAQAFDITRAYFIVREELSENTAVRVTFDGAALRDELTDGANRSRTGNLLVVLKHAYLEYKNLWPDSSIVFGQAELPWLGWEESQYGYRMQGTLFADREGYLTTTDLGVHARGKLPAGWGDYHVSYVNGEGWTRPEGFYRHGGLATSPDSFDTKHKNVEARLTLTPFAAGDNAFLKGIMFSGFVDYGKYASNRDLRLRVLAAVTWKYSDWLTLMGEYLYAEDPRSYAPRAANQLEFPVIPALGSVDRNGTGYRNGDAVAEGFSIWNVVNLGVLAASLKDFDLVQRYDWLDPDEDVRNNGHLRTIHGIAWRMNKNVTLLLDYQTERYDKARAAVGATGPNGGPTFDDGTGDTRPDTATIFLHTQIKF